MPDINETPRGSRPPVTLTAAPFAYTVQMDVAHLLPADAGGSIVTGRFTHFNAVPIEVGLGEAAGQLNLGFLLFAEDEATHILEGRALFETAVIPPAEPVRCSLFIPRSAIGFGRQYRLLLDVVCERYFWFRQFGEAGITARIGFCDAADAHRLQLQQLQAPVLEDKLLRAHARVAELELAERRLRIERDVWRDRAGMLGALVEHDRQALGLLPPPAAAIERLLRTHDPVQRRDLWLGALSAAGAEGAAYGLYPHDGVPGRLRILVHGAGGLGDMLYTSAVVRELHETFHGADIVVLYENPQVGTIYAANPHVAAALALPHDGMAALLRTACTLDIFDLIAEVRYAVTYITPPLSRVPMPFRLRANAAAAEWQKYVRYDWPHLNNMFANAVMARGLNKLDLVGLTSLLPIDRHADLDLFILPDALTADWPTLAGIAYATVHHGADPNMAAAAGVQTKNLPAALWAQVVAKLQAQGLRVVQLGEAREQEIAGVDLDLRGLCTFTQSAHLIKHARVHVDTEGGLVHAARAVGTCAVVLFGPTPPAFFGYPQNVNLAPRRCGNCWWLTRRWSIECPRGLAAPECMTTHDPADIAAQAMALARPDRVLDVEVIGAFAGLPPLAGVLAGLASALPGEGLLLAGPDLAAADAGGADLARLAATHLPQATLLVETAAYRALLDARPDTVPIKPYSVGNIPLGTARHGWGVGLGLDPSVPDAAALLFDLFRCLGHGAPCLLLAVAPQGPRVVAPWLDAMAATVARLQGGGWSLRLPPAAGGPADDTMAGSLLLRLTQAAAGPPTPAPGPAAVKRRRRAAAHVD